MNEFDDLQSDDLDTEVIEHRVTYTQVCAKCGGSGRFVSYTGRLIGNCFACKGAGKFERLTSPVAREKARQYRVAKAEKTAQERIDEFAQANPQAHAWIASKAASFDFAKAMLDAITKYGSLTERQLETVLRMAAADEQRAQARAARIEQCDVSKVVAAFAAARAAGVKYPKMRLAGFTFSSAPAHGQNAGGVYAKEGDTYLGKVLNGQFSPSRDCAPEVQVKVIAAATDPEAAAVAYGKEYGECSICGRELSNQESIDRGIGPICAQKFGW